MNIHEITHTKDDDGHKIVQVPLSNSHMKVKLWEKDYAELVDMGAGLPWKYSQGQVIVRNNNKNINVARLILDIDKGFKVSFLDKDATNLCRSNLLKIAGNGLYRTRDQLEDAAISKFKRSRISTEYRDIRP